MIETSGPQHRYKFITYIFSNLKLIERNNTSRNRCGMLNQNRYNHIWYQFCSSLMGTEKNSRFRNFAFLGFSRINENNPEIIGAAQARSVLVINDIRSMVHLPINYQAQHIPYLQLYKNFKGEKFIFQHPNFNWRLWYLGKMKMWSLPPERLKYGIWLRTWIPYN